MSRSRPSRRANTTPDPLAPQGSGGPFSWGTANQIERGTILSVDANGQVYHVALNSGRALHMGRLLSHPGDSTLLPARTPVVVTWALGLPYILGVLPPEVAANPAVTPSSVTDVPGHGGDDPVLSRPMGAVARAPDAPRDVMPGDFVGRSPDGASVSALHGQVAQLRGGPLAKVAAFGDTDSVQILAGLLRVVTWMGESRIVNDDGKTSFIWRGGSDQLTQTGADEESYTIKLDVGHEGGVIRLEVCTREGQCLFRFRVTNDGACELYAAGGMSQHGGSSQSQSHPIRFHGERVTEVAGGDVHTVYGDVATSCEGSRAENTGSNLSTVVGNDQTISIGGDRSDLVVGRSLCSVGSHARTAVGGNCELTVTGSGSYAVKTVSGPIRFSPGGVFEVLGNLVDQVRLGTGADFHATRFEALQAYLDAKFADLDGRLALVALHAHGVSGPVANPSPTIATVGTSTPVDLGPAKSHGVKIN